MTKETAIKLFETKQVRTQWTKKMKNGFFQ